MLRAAIAGGRSSFRSKYFSLATSAPGKKGVRILPIADHSAFRSVSTITKEGNALFGAKKIYHALIATSFKVHNRATERIRKHYRLAEQLRPQVSAKTNGEQHALNTSEALEPDSRHSSALIHTIKSMSHDRAH